VTRNELFGSRIIQRRKEFGWKQDRLALAIKTPRSTLAYWETGKSYPNMPRLICLARALNVSLDWLLGMDV
jgi:transcriptional regulator with XRE-family HTH domain